MKSSSTSSFSSHSSSTLIPFVLVTLNVILLHSDPIHCTIPLVCDPCRSLPISVPGESTTTTTTTTSSLISSDGSNSNSTISILDGGTGCKSESATGSGSVSTTNSTTTNNGIGGCQSGIEFCGKDGICYPNSCRNFYTFGNTYYTGVPIDAYPDINCTTIDQIVQVIDEEVAQFPVSILYGTTCPFPEEPPKCLPNDEKAAANSVFFTEICRAYPTNDSVFTCYDLAVGTNFSKYKLSTMETNNNNTSSSSAGGYHNMCGGGGDGDGDSGSSEMNTTTTGDDNDKESSVLPKHRYSQNVARVDYTKTVDDYGCTQNSMSQTSDTIEELLAFGTLTSVLVIGTEPPSDTILPTISPSEEITSSSSLVPSVSLSVALLGGFVYNFYG